MGMHDLKLSRRDALAGGGALVLAIALPMVGLKAQTPAAAPPAPIEPNAYIRIAADDSVTIVVKHIEFGQGPYTGLATIAAEELDADWSKVRAVSAPADAKLYGNAVIGGMQLTGGSSAIASSYDLMRRAGATARAMLVQAAATQWKVPASEISVDKGVIAHKKSGKSSGFGAFAAAAAKLPVPADVPLKDPAKFTLIGKDQSVRRLDSADKTTGRAIFAIDIREPGLLTVLVARSPRFGGKVASYDAAAALKVKGVVAVRQISTGVAVYATGMWAAIKGRKALQIAWDDSKAEMRSSDAMMATYLDKAATPSATVHGKTGDVDAALKAGGELVEASYSFPYLAHAPMEPLDGYMRWDGTKVLARFGAQGTTLDQMAISKTLGITPDKVEIEVMLSGGSFGRRATPVSHFAVELSEVAKAIGPNKPVKLVWTREDDIHGGYYRPMFVHRFKGTVKDGKIAAWQNTLVGQSFMANGPFAGTIKNGVDGSMSEGASKPLYALADFRCDVHTVDSPVSTLWWRSVGHTHTGYAVECFVDQLLVKAGQDPVAGRLALMGDNPRAAGVLRAVAKLADWDGAKPAKGRARGVAVVESFSTVVAQIAEVSIGDNGEPKVHKVWAAVDCGVAVNPDVIRAQLEGGIGFALGHALYAEVPLKDGVPAVSNFHDYRSLRINEMPEVEVVVIPSTAKPTGIGEPGVPAVAPAVANALAALGQVRPARLPMVRA